MTSIDDNGTNLTPDPELIRVAMEAIQGNRGLFEVRVLKVRRDGPARLYGNVFNGFYDDIDAAVRDVSRITGRDAAGVFMTFNELDPILRNCGLNRLMRSESATADTDVTRLRYIFVDLDPARRALTNANGAEHAAALSRLDEVRAHLRSGGWPDPTVAGSSGSGAMALYQCDLLPSESGLVEYTLQTLAAQFNDDLVNIDTSVSNPARMVRIPGTVNAKSTTPQPDRPWTLATATVVKP